MALALTRDRIPEIKSAAITITAIDSDQPLFVRGSFPAPASFDGECLPADLFCIFSLRRHISSTFIACLACCLALGRMLARTLQNAEKCRDKEERRNRRENQSANDRPSKRSVLFAAIP